MKNTRKTNMSTTLKALLPAVCILATPVALADEDSAISACEQKIRHEYGADKFRHVWAEKDGHHKYRVYGQVKMHDHKYPFSCKIRDGHVKSYSFEGPHGKDDDSDAAGAIAVAAGLAIVAAMAADGSVEDNGDHERLHHRRSHLEDDCHDELAYRIRDEHHRSAEVTMKSATLEGFDLKGEARVQYEGHHPHKATYTCHFNEKGYLVDSRYRLY
jgi:hypothetical protein